LLLPPLPWQEIRGIEEIFQRTDSFFTHDNHKVRYCFVGIGQIHQRISFT
jgi:hypothetical protein